MLHLRLKLMEPFIALASLREDGFDPLLLFFDYGLQLTHAPVAVEQGNAIEMLARHVHALHEIADQRALFPERSDHEIQMQRLRARTELDDLRMLFKLALTH